MPVFNTRTAQHQVSWLWCDSMCSLVVLISCLEWATFLVKGHEDRRVFVCAANTVLFADWSHRSARGNRFAELCIGHPWFGHWAQQAYQRGTRSVHTFIMTLPYLVAMFWRQMITSRLVGEAHEGAIFPPVTFKTQELLPSNATLFGLVPYLLTLKVYKKVAHAMIKSSSPVVCDLRTVALRFITALNATHIEMLQN